MSSAEASLSKETTKHNYSTGEKQGGERTERS